MRRWDSRPFQPARLFVSILEVWHDGKFIATVTGAEGPDVRVISKHQMAATVVEGYPNEVEVKVMAERR